MSKVKSNYFCLFNYRLSDELAKVFGQDISENKATEGMDVERIWLSDNGLTD